MYAFRFVCQQFLYKTFNPSRERSVLFIFGSGRNGLDILQSFEAPSRHSLCETLEYLRGGRRGPLLIRSPQRYRLDHHEGWVGNVLYFFEYSSV